MQCRYLPTQGMQGVDEVLEMPISFSGYIGRTRQMLKYIASKLGAKPHTTFCKRDRLLVCASQESEKCVNSLSEDSFFLTDVSSLFVQLRWLLWVWVDASLFLSQRVGEVSELSFLKLFLLRYSFFFFTTEMINVSLSRCVAISLQ